ncbi:MAG: hypothetical protein KCHDKBKB_01520 [Elusimicrobia bacterium]|nr:hypothetical protein [Elusimicrobiota bacterium]
MHTTQDPENSSILFQLKKVITDGIDYAGSALTLLQAQATALAAASAAFLFLVFFAGLAVIIAFALLSVALGLWLTHLTGSAGWALLIIGGIYLLLAVLCGAVALHWLKRLKS